MFESKQQLINTQRSESVVGNESVMTVPFFFFLACRRNYGLNQANNLNSL